MKHTNDIIDMVIAQAFAERIEKQPQSKNVTEPVFRNHAHNVQKKEDASFAANYWQRVTVAAAIIAFCFVLPAVLWTISDETGMLRHAAARSYTEGFLRYNSDYFISLMKQGGAAL